MTTDCPNCGKPLKGKEQEKLICYTCGTIIDTNRIVQIGMGKYKFIDDQTDYIIPFESIDELEEFQKLANSQKEEYKYCKIVCPRETIIIV